MISWPNRLATAVGLLCATSALAADISNPPGLLLETRLCQTPSTLIPALQGRLDIPEPAALADLVERILCAPSDDGMGQLSPERFAENAADPFSTGLTFYQGMQTLGQWPLDDGQAWSRAEAYFSTLGLMAGSPIPGASLWQRPAAGQVRVWYAPFLRAPSDAVTLDFRYRDGRWLWTAAHNSARM